jgi:Leucine-rich repeat (LRR) protein
VDIRFINTGISQLTSPLISKQLAGMIRGLEITGTRITRIDEKVFDGLPKLKELGLMESSINDKLLNSGWLTSNLGKTLEVLDFSYNNLNTIQEGSFQNLASLIQLRVSGNQIQQVMNLFYLKIKYK